jgi:hypothetical protein
MTTERMGDHGRAQWVSARCEREVRGALLGAQLSEGSDRVGVGSRKRSARGEVAGKRVTWARPRWSARARG